MKILYLLIYEILLENIEKYFMSALQLCLLQDLHVKKIFCINVCKKKKMEI